MKNKRALWILLAVLAVLIVVLVLVLRGGAEDEEESSQIAEPAAQTAEEDLTLWSVDASQVTAMTWESENGGMDALRSGGTWVWEAQPGLELDQAAMSALAEALSGLTASRALDTTGVDLGEFSLDAPKLTITFTALGQEATIALGLRNAGLGQDYALYQDQVYLIPTDLFDAFNVSPYSLLVNDFVPTLTPDQLTALTLEGPEGAILTLRHPEDPAQYTYCDSYTWFSMDDQGGFTALGASQVNALLRQVTGLDLSNCVGAYPDLNQRPEAVASVSVLFGGETPEDFYTLCFASVPEEDPTVLLDGDAALDPGEEEDTVLVYEARSPLVCEVPASALTDILETSLDDLLPEDICPIPFAELQAFTFLIEGEEYRVDVLDQETGTAYALNGTTIDRSTASGLYSQLTGLAVEAAVSGSDRSTDQASVQVKLYRNRETYSVMTLSLIPYDSSFYVVDFAGQQRLLVSIRDVEALIAAVRQTGPAS